MFDLNGKIILVSGAARGQGEAMARLFVELGAKVLLGDVRDELGSAVAADIGPSATYVHLDVTLAEDWKRAVSMAVGTYGALNGLVNGAGIIAGGPTETQCLDEYLKVIMVNQVGAFLGTQAVICAMREAGGGSIVNVGSAVSEIAFPLPSIAYTSSKFALRGITKCTALELGPDNIRVNLLIPGPMITPMTFDHEMSRAANISIGRRLPLGRMGEAIEAARMAAFLLSDASSYSTGGDFAVDGGFTAGHLREPQEAPAAKG